MTTWIEVSATDRSGGLFKSKAALKRAHAADPAGVIFRSVGDAVGNYFRGPVAMLADLPENTRLTVVGPNPFTDRRWYATVEVKNGKIKIS